MPVRRGNVRPVNQPPSSEDALTRIDRDIEAAAERARQASSFRAALEQLRGHATVHGVQATVDGGGLLADIEFHCDLAEVTPGDLRSDVLAAMRAAQQDVAEQIRERARHTYGDSTPTTRHLDEELRARFGAP